MSEVEAWGAMHERLVCSLGRVGPRPERRHCLPCSHTACATSRRRSNTSPRPESAAEQVCGGGGGAGGRRCLPCLLVAQLHSWEQQNERDELGRARGCAAHAHTHTSPCLRARARASLTTPSRRSQRLSRPPVTSKCSPRVSGGGCARCRRAEAAHQHRGGALQIARRALRDRLLPQHRPRVAQQDVRAPRREQATRARARARPRPVPAD